MLDEFGVDYEYRHIKKDNPQADEVKAWSEQYGIAVDKFFNPRGATFRKLGLKDELPHMSEEEKLETLSTNGLLAKRPLLFIDDQLFIGFDKDEWTEKLSQ